MNDNDINYYFRLIKGRITENIAEEMFVKLGFNIERFGVESKFPAITAALKKYENTATVQQIRNMPDFIIYKEDFSPRFLEVKYRHNSLLCYAEIKKYRDFPNVIFIIFDRENIFTYYPETELNSEKYIPIEKVLRDDENFNFSDEQKDIIDCFTLILKSVFRNIKVKI